MKWWNIWHFLSYSYSCLPHKKHVSRQRFLGHLVKKSLVVNCAELCQLLWKSFFVSFCSLLILLLLLFWQFLPFLSYHSDHFCDFDAGIFPRDNGPLLVAKQNVCRLRFLNGNVFGCIECSTKLCEVSEIDSNFAITVENRTKTIFLGALVISIWEVVMYKVGTNLLFALRSVLHMGLSVHFLLES